MLYAVIALSFTTVYFIYLSGRYAYKYFYILSFARQMLLEHEANSWVESQQVIDILIEHKVSHSVVNIFKNRYRWMDNSNWTNPHSQGSTHKVSNVV